MKLAEALALRSDASRRFEQLRSRAQANARGARHRADDTLIELLYLFTTREPRGRGRRRN